YALGAIGHPQRCPILISAGVILMRRLLILFAIFAPFSASAQQSAPPTIVLLVGTALDGRGHILHGTSIVIGDGKILRLDPNIPKVSKIQVYDLRAYTVLPGWIDAHTHPSWHFDAAGRLAGEEPKEQTALAAAANSWKMLAAGFTTVQSLGL